MNLNSRLRSLERATGAGPRVCGTCGRPTDGRRAFIGNDQIRVHGGSEGEPPCDGPEACPECGTSLIIRIEFDRGNG